MILVMALAALLATAQPPVADWLRAAEHAEQSGRYRDAVDWYARILREAPVSSAARQASTRSAELTAYSDHDFEPYRRFEALKDQYAAWGSDRAVAEAQAVVHDYPAAAIVPEMLLWLGNEHREARNDLAGALAAYRRLAGEFPEHPLAVVALDRAGRILEAQGNHVDADAVYARLVTRYPASDAAQAFAKRRAQVSRGLWRMRISRVAWGVVGGSVLVFLAVGGWRADRRKLWALAPSKVGFAALLGLPPAAFLWLYDGIWSPSLTAFSILFAAYGVVLAALRARPVWPQPRWTAVAERVVFGVLAPLALLALLVSHFSLWDVFFL